MSDVVPELMAASHADNWPPDGRVICASIGEKAAAEILSLRAQVVSLVDREATLSTECNHWMSEANRLRVAVAAVDVILTRWQSDDDDAPTNNNALCELVDVRKAAIRKGG